MIPDLLNIISEYMDLGSYRLMIPESKVFTIEKYYEYQECYKNYFMNEITSKWYSIYCHLTENKNTSKYLFIKNTFAHLKELMYAFEYCDFFICTNQDWDVVNTKTPIQDLIRKCELEGYLILDLKMDDKVKICYGKQAIDGTGGLYYDRGLFIDDVFEPSRSIEKYWAVYASMIGSIMSYTDLYFSPNLIEDGIRQYTNNGVDGVLNLFFNSIPNLIANPPTSEELESQYEDIVELVNMRNKE